MMAQLTAAAKVGTNGRPNLAPAARTSVALIAMRWVGTSCGQGGWLFSRYDHLGQRRAIGLLSSCLGRFRPRFRQQLRPVPRASCCWRTTTHMILGAFVGASLGVAGAMMQGLFRIRWPIRTRSVFLRCSIGGSGDNHWAAAAGPWCTRCVGVTRGRLPWRFATTMMLMLIAPARRNGHRPLL